MRILHVEDFFHPDAGYQINILPKYMANEGHEVTIITSEISSVPKELTNFFGRDNIVNRDNYYMKKNNVQIVRVKSKGFISGRAIFSSDIYSAIEQFNPEIIYLHGNDTLTAIRLLLRYYKSNIPIVMDSHMLEMASQNKFSKLFRSIYKKCISPIVIKEKIPVIRTQNDEYVMKYLGIPIEQAPWISVGSDTLLFRPDKNIKKRFRIENGISEDEFVVIYTGKLDDAKGGLLLAKAFKKKFNTQKNIVLVVVGNTEGEYGKKVEKEFSESENRILRFKTQKYVDLPEFYQASDLSIFPKQCSLSFYDAQACGLPVISEDNNINEERLAHNNGFTFDSDNINEIRQKVILMAEMNEKYYQVMVTNSIEYVRKNYDYMEISRRYLEIIEKEVEKKSGDNEVGEN